MLGYKAAHFPADLWDDPMNIILMDYDAFFDNPIPVIYRDLDTRFPGSKFILTLRDQQRWLQSCEWMFNNMREAWGFDVSERIKSMHYALYGTNEFDEARFSKAYRQHTMNVLDYFSERREDLLVLDLDAEEELWDVLCGFLKTPVPNSPFPRSNTTRTNRFRLMRQRIRGFLKR